MEKIKGYRTLIVAGAYVVLGVAAALGLGLSPEEAAQADTFVSGIVSLITNPVVIGIVFGALRLATKTPVGGGEPSAGW